MMVSSKHPHDEHHLLEAYVIMWILEGPLGSWIPHPLTSMTLIQYLLPDSWSFWGREMKQSNKIAYYFIWRKKCVCMYMARTTYANILEIIS